MFAKLSVDRAKSKNCQVFYNLASVESERCVKCYQSTRILMRK